jgi:hypothetical protein
MQVVGELAGHSHPTGFGVVLELAVAPTRGDHCPAVFFEKPDEFADLH